MTRTFRRCESTCAGAFLAFCCALASLPLLLPAVLPALLWSSGPEGALMVLVLFVWAVLVALVGLLPGTRGVLVVASRRLLRIPLTVPAGRRSAAGLDRWRTPLWLVLLTGLGWVVLVLTTVLVAAGVALPDNWVGGDAGLAIFGRTLRFADGWASWIAALVCLVAAVAVCLMVGALVRWITPGLLGPSAAERLALAVERERALAERNRLAHELHDSIGHTLTATTIQAEVASEVLTSDPAVARAALHSIQSSSRLALEDLDYVLGLLREETAGPAPNRTLADLPELIDRLRHAGAVVEPHLSGDLERVHGTLSRAAYRIVQEGLTNALRHGGGEPIALQVTVGPQELDLTLRNALASGAPRAFPPSGHGLAGLTERVRLLRGEIQAGPDGSQCWRLAVRLPLWPSA